jgi:undecaprenyl-diphosphatase
MNIILSVFLGIVQGLSEFLPISSSAHLAIIQSLMPGFSQPGVLFDVVLHFGTILAVILYFWKEIISFIEKNFIALVIGTIPAGVFGFLFQDFIEGLFSSVKLIALMLLITGVMDILIDSLKGPEERVKSRDSLIIGVFQAFAIIPGISRSGSTIFAASKLGIKKELAAKFSFFLALPAVLGANFLEILKYKGNVSSAMFAPYLFGFLAALIFGYFSIRLVFRFLTQKKFRFFGYYCLILGLIILLFL